MTSSVPRRAARRAAAGLGIAAVSLSTAVLAAAPASALAAGDQVTLLGINDFHGALSAGDKLACTVVTAEGQNPNSVLLSAGDNVGGSAFESAVANDEPTIDYLNTLGVAATAIGNHEYDQGQDDLTGRIEPRTDFPDLAANVYVSATGERLHDPYTIVQAGDVKVAVVGAVTTKTLAKVSPAAIEGLEFRDPVTSVNEAISELDASGADYDVLVASYHEGASGSGAVGSAPANSDPTFDEIVADTSPEVDAIFNGDSHQTYAFDAPVPGQSPEPRPVAQTGASGANLGSITLTLGEDGDWDATTDGTTLLPTADADLDACAGNATYEAASTVAADAIADAAVQGAVPVGSITGDVTTSWNDTKAQYDADGVRVPLTEPAPDKQGSTKGDDRTRHSAAGNMLADSMKWYLEERGSTQEHEVIGLMNPGGIRAELWDAAAGDEGDGVVTYAEANSMVPFGNTLNSGDITGAQLKEVLEQQWQRGEDGADTGRFLAFSVSNNVEYVTDSSRPFDDRVVEVRVNGEPITDDAVSTSVAASFLSEGGDNMWALTGATNVRDSGVLDRDAFVEYLGANPDLAPDYSQRQLDVQQSGDTLPTLTITGLDSLSLGAPQITEATVDAGDLGVFTAPVTVDATTGRATAQVTIDPETCLADGDSFDVTISGEPETGTSVTRTVTVSGGEDCSGTDGGSGHGKDNPNRGPGNNSGKGKAKGHDKGNGPADNPNRGPGNNSGKGNGSSKKS